MTYTISWETFLALRDVVEGELPDARLLADYSGRAMYGGTCLALTGHDGATDLVRFVLTLAESVAVAGDVDEDDPVARVQELLDVLRHTAVSQDQLGLGTVFYWRNVAVTS